MARFLINLQGAVEQLIFEFQNNNVEDVMV